MTTVRDIINHLQKLNPSAQVHCSEMKDKIVTSFVAHYDTENSTWELQVVLQEWAEDDAN